MNARQIFVFVCIYFVSFVFIYLHKRGPQWGSINVFFYLVQIPLQNKVISISDAIILFLMYRYHCYVPTNLFGGHYVLPLSVRTSIRPSRFVTLICNSPFFSFHWPNLTKSFCTDGCQWGHPCPMDTFLVVLNLNRCLKLGLLFETVSQKHG